MADVNLVDLEVIKRYSLAIRQESAPADEVLAVLELSRDAVLAVMAAEPQRGRAAEPRGKKAPSPRRAPAKTPAKRTPAKKVAKAAKGAKKASTTRRSSR
jgi:hypothetical protein